MQTAVWVLRLMTVNMTVSSGLSLRSAFIAGLALRHGKAPGGYTPKRSAGELHWDTGERGNSRVYTGNFRRKSPVGGRPGRRSRDERAPDKVIRSRQVLVLTKRQGAWKIGWGQNTRLADSVPDSDCFVELRK
jgi:hypothetical protein